jgi:hypothetical protein
MGCVDPVPRSTVGLWCSPRPLTRGGDADAPRPWCCHPRDSRGVGAVARAPDGQAAAAACVPPCLVNDSTPNAVYMTIRSGDGREDAYLTGVFGSAVAGCSTRHPSAPAGGRLLDLQLIQPHTPSQFLQTVRHHAKATTTAVQLQAVLRLQATARGFLA